MMDPDGSLGERVTIVETDIKHIVSGIARIEDGIARTRNELDGRNTETRAELKADIGSARTELANVRTELKADIGDLRTELKADIGDLRTELKTDIGSVRTELANVRTELKEDLQRGFDNMERVMTHNKTALYAICGTVIAAVAGSLVKGWFF